MPYCSVGGESGERGSIGWLLKLQGKRFLGRIENDYCLLYQSEGEQDKSKAAAWIQPKTVSRADTRTIIVDSGRNSFGKLVLGFDTVADADKAEAVLKGMQSDKVAG